MIQITHLSDSPTKIFPQVRCHHILLKRLDRLPQSIIELHIALGRKVCIVLAISTMFWLAVDENVIATDENRTPGPLFCIIGDFALLAQKYEYGEAAVHLELVASDASGPVDSVEWRHGFFSPCRR